ncbi:alpha/beta fold hydrolase [Vallicoccus soli]|uniref:AB hydrolase-1 domain-containing protein n=1 Tax=Vallicoccus soli TaxID=2339232 RepID=A0A3A3Z7A1_9ACTN|nr:alpha/beta fold hydrolase [Vallicoccus soli]RJK97807.1 hypothetical protein D5H78_02135 [Vallicoccus soli]
MRGPTVVLLHSPLTSAAVWGGLPAALLERGRRVHAPDVGDDLDPPFATAYAASAARQCAAAGSAVLVAHSGAGALAGLVAALLREGGTDVEAHVLLDAVLPPAVPATRLALLRAEDPVAAAAVEEVLREGRRFPDYGDALGDPALAATLRPRDLAFFDEPVPATPGWPDAPASYVQLSAAYDAVADEARGRGLPVHRLLLGHFAAWEHPEPVAELLDGVLP